MASAEPPTDGRTDGELLRAARTGDRGAFAALCERHGERLRRFLQTMTGDDHAAEDLRQDALRLALERLDQLEDPDRFGSWLLAIAVNRCRNHLRDEVARAARRQDPAASAAPGGLPDELPDRGRRSALSSLVRREAAALVALAVDRLPILLREAFVLFHVEGLAYAQIAQLTGASEGTLQVRVHRARALLRQQLGSLADTTFVRPA